MSTKSGVLSRSTGCSTIRVDDEAEVGTWSCLELAVAGSPAVGKGRVVSVKGGVAPPDVTGR